MEGEFGSIEHMEKVWAWCKGRLLGQSEGDASKLSRWWNFEVLGRRCLKDRFPNLLVLLWIGSRKSWWQSAAQCPLYRPDSPEPEDAADEPLPGEALGQPEPDGDAPEEM